MWVNWLGLATLCLALLISTTTAQYGGKKISAQPYEGPSKTNSASFRSPMQQPMEMIIITQEEAQDSRISQNKMRNGYSDKEKVMMMPMMKSTNNGNGYNSKMMKKMAMSMSQYSQPSPSNGYSEEPVRAAVKSSHMIDYIDVPNEQPNITPQTILVEANNIPLNILFQSKSSDINIQNEHIPSKGTMQETSSEDEPHHLIHRVTKPIIQEVFEVIKPYRKITQEIQPVQEEIQTIVSRAIQDSKYVPVNNQFKGKNTMNMNMQSMPMIKSQPQSYGSSYKKEERDMVAQMINAIKMKEMAKNSYMPTQPTEQTMSRQYIPMQSRGESDLAMSREYMPMNMPWNTFTMSPIPKEQGQSSSRSYQPGQNKRMEMYLNTQIMNGQSSESRIKIQQDNMQQINQAQPLPIRTGEVQLGSNSATDELGLDQEMQIKDVESNSVARNSDAKGEKVIQSIMMYNGASPIITSPQPSKETSSPTGASTSETTSARNFAQQTSDYAESNTEPSGY